MSENTDLKLTAEAWAEIVIERWERKIMRLKIGFYKGGGDLAKSFAFHVNADANGNPELIEFAFNYYGKFVDMGVGNGVQLSEVSVSNRKAKPWYSKTFFSEIERLRVIMAEKYGQKAQMTIVNNIEKTEI